MKRHKIIIERVGLYNEYISGRIFGMIHVLSGMPEKVYAWDRTDRYESLPFECTDEQFRTIVEAIGRNFWSSITYKFI
jgi:hypothetical protein